MDLGRIRALADAFDASDWDEIHLVVDGVEIHLSALPQEAPTVSDASSLTFNVSNSPSSATEQPPAENGELLTSDVSDDPSLTSEGASGAAGTPVGAPSPGIFWRAPSPGAAPFVQVGDRVEADTVVGIVELMKLMNRVAAGMAGTVTAVLVANGESVEKGGPLVLIDPT